MTTRLLLSVRQLVKHFPTKTGIVRAIDGISFGVYARDTLGLVGESGSGKTTTAQCILGIYPPTSGEIDFADCPISMKFRKRTREMKGRIRIVFQDPGSSLNPKRTIKQILSVPLRVHGIGQRQTRDRLMHELLEMVELPPNEYLYKHPQAMGGGEKQMVAIARALATNPRLVVLDEPTSALDVSVQGKIINLLARLGNEMDLTYLFITHDLSLMRNVATRVAIMYLGKLCEIARTDIFFRAPRHPYTKMLLSSIPVVTEAEEALKPSRIVSRGEIPSPVNVPTGCSFHLRCPHKMPVCSEVDPQMAEFADGHAVRCHLYPVEQDMASLLGSAA